MSEHVRVERVGAMLSITLARPERRNAITVAMYSALADAVDSAANDASIRVITFHGEGQDFAAGNDLADFLAAAPRLDEEIPVGGCSGHSPVARRQSSPPFMAIASASGRPCCFIATSSSPTTAPASRCRSSTLGWCRSGKLAAVPAARRAAPRCPLPPAGRTVRHRGSAGHRSRQPSCRGRRARRS